MPNPVTDRSLLGKIFHFPNGSVTRSDRPLDGEKIAPIPSFRCYGCGQVYFADPPMLIVRYPGGEIRFCVDNCALEEGFAAAVEARWLAEFDGEAFPFIWADDRYEAIESFEDLFGGPPGE